MKKIWFKVTKFVVESALIAAIAFLFVPALLSAQSTVAVLGGLFLTLLLLIYVIVQAIQAIGKLIAASRNP